MSMILDAIKRSKEAPEKGGSVPSLDTEHYVAPDQLVGRYICLLYTSPSPRD